jgi:hypothetical protein
MSLRDQPTLDQHQDEIFRRPLESQLLILGPPGSGKTTTLIRRLGQKLDLGALDENERELLDVIAQDRAAEHAQSWMMFTPTDLLKQYVKEAFAREDIPAPDERIRTWDDFRRELARNTFSILRAGAGSGIFILKELPIRIKSATVPDQIRWFEDFYSWQASRLWRDLESAAFRLERSNDPEVKAIGERLLPILPGPQPASTVVVLAALTALGDRVQGIVSKRSADVDSRIRRALTVQVNRNRSFLDELAAFLAGLADLEDELEESDSEADEEEEEEEQQSARPGRQAALIAYMRAMRSLARAEAARRSLGRNSRAAKVVAWLGDRMPSREERLAIGENLEILAAARRFSNPVRGYMRGFAGRYRAFRRARQGEGSWYSSERFAQSDITPLEVDVILLSIVESAVELMRDRRILADMEPRNYLELSRVRDLYKNQVMVDEATDFSPIQLRIMGRLAHPQTQSFFACGDFNQRITEWGTRSIEEVKWAVPRIEVKSMTITYRHSRQLNDLAKRIAQSGGDRASEAILPEYVNSEGVAPVLGIGLSTEHDIANWLAKRIAEIERFTQKLPSIAILVNNEASVQPIASSLDKVLQAQNLRAVACREGRTIGQENDVRVFDVRHIKGLEFEAVFFIGIDDLADASPQLFDKFLYVGATRAASYLGLTCSGDRLPDKIAELRSSFIESWAM